MTTKLISKSLFGLAVGAAMLALVAGCDKVEDMGRKAVRKSGDLVGKGAAEFFSGVGEGVDAVTKTGPDVLTAISTRTSIRKFDATRPVEDEKVERCCAPR